ncbi:MAG: hypothetical protein PVI30_26955 [Myxococcales bacterium]|jgi:hypothetical protein
MSGVRAAQGAAEDRAQPAVPAEAAEVQQMQDVLYDILATGMDPEQDDVPVEEIERFLHEHARAAKSGAEFRAFFERHGLSLRLADVDAPAPPSLSLPPLPAPVSAPVLQLPVQQEPPGGPEQQMVPPTPALPQAQGPAGDPRPSRAVPLLGIAVALLLAGLAVVIWLGLGALERMQQELLRAEQRSNDNARVIDELEGRAAGIQSSIEANGQLIDRMERKSDLLIEKLVTEPESRPQRKRWR